MNNKLAIASHTHLYSVILAGGSGTRLWPISRELYPKQLLALLGKKTLIQQTFTRLKKLTPAERIYIVTKQTFATDILLQLKPFGFKKDHLLIEPEQRNTASAIGLASAMVAEKDKDAVLLVCPADHLISPTTAFSNDVTLAMKSALGGNIVVFGISPDAPSPEYGYIKPESTLVKNTIVQESAFVEKPSVRVAEEYIKSGYMWNAGIFLFEAKTMLAAVKKFLPELSTLLTSKHDASVEDFAIGYNALPSISVDNGVLEKTKNVAVIRASFKWQDIGSWKILYELMPHDKNNNVENEDSFAIDCTGSMILGSPNRVVAAIDMDDVIIIDTEDAVLVTKRDSAHRIKEVFTKIKASGRSQHREHRTSFRPWGSYTILQEGEYYKVKKLVVNPGERLSLQSHEKRSEHWTVIAGVAKATIGRDTRYLEEGESIDIPFRAKHRLENPGEDILEIIEVQRGDYLGEDDIIRYEDKYNR